MSRYVRLVLTSVVLLGTLLIGAPTVAAAAAPDNSNPPGTRFLPFSDPQRDEQPKAACASGSLGAPASNYLPMTRWSGATTSFHSRLSWNDIVDKVQREGIMENGMAAGNFMYSLSESMVSAALRFCLLDKVGYDLDRAAAGIGQALLDSTVLALLVVAAFIAAVVAMAKGRGSQGLRGLFTKALLVGLMVAMVAGAWQSTEDSTGSYEPGVLSPGWFAVTIDSAVTTVASAPVMAMYKQASPVTGADTEPGKKKSIFDCDVHMAAMRAKYQEDFARSRAESVNAMVPMVMSGIWENSGLATWRISQYGNDNSLADRVYCHHLDMTAQPGRYSTYGVMEKITPGYRAWAQQKVNGSPLVDSQMFNPQSDTARDIAIVAWAACRPEGGSFEEQAANLTKYAPNEDKGKVKNRWQTDGTLMVRGGLDDSTLSGDIAQAVKSGAGELGDKAVGALDTVTFGGMSKMVNWAKDTAGTIKGLLGVGDDDEEYDPNLSDAEQAVSCNNLFNWSTERWKETNDDDDGGGPFGDTTFPNKEFLAHIDEKLGAKSFNWGNEASNIQAFATYDTDAGRGTRTDQARDFLLTLHGNKNLNGTVGVLIYMLSAVGMVAVFGLLAAAVLLAKVMAGAFIVICFFVLAAALASSRDMEQVTKFAKAYLGLSLFAWGAIALMAVLGLLSAILSTLGESFGGWLTILWAGMSPLLAAIVVHKVFKDVLHLPSPFRLTAGLAYANTISKAGGTTAMSGLDAMTNKGAGMVKRAASTGLGMYAAERFRRKGQEGSRGGAGGVYGQMTPKGTPAKGQGPATGSPAEADPEKLGTTPTKAQAAVARAELQRRANDPGATKADRKKAKQQLRAMDNQHRRDAVARTAQAKQADRKNGSMGSRARNIATSTGGKTVMAGAVVAGAPGAVVAGGAYAGVKAVKAGRDMVAQTTGLGHSAMMERAQADLDAWYQENEAQQRAQEQAAEEAAAETARREREAQAQHVRDTSRLNPRNRER